MDPKLILLSTGIVLVAATSMIGTRIVVKQRHRSVFRARVEDFVPLASTVQVVVQTPEEEAKSRRLLPEFAERWLRPRMELAGWNAQPGDVVLRSICIFTVVTTVGVTLNPAFLPIWLCVALVCGSIPIALLSFQAKQTRQKLELQLPNALDLMVSVLRSGHAVPQSIKAVANEMPNPCGREFGEVLHRINLGQPLPEALSYTAVRYQSFEIDLLRRAFHIHADVGGSLAELLDKTNTTLKGRIKLKRHVDVLTAPSRLTSIIVALLPFVVGGGCYALNPAYLDPLTKTTIGRVFICLGLMLQVAGILIMRRMASFKV